MLQQEEKVDICSIEDDGERNAVWNMIYFEKWGHFPSKKLQSIYESFYLDHKFKSLVDDLLDKLRKAGQKLENINSQDILYASEQIGEKDGASDAVKAIGKGLSYLVAREIVKASIGGGIGVAIVAIDQTAARAAATGGALACEILGFLGVEIASAIGEFVVGQIAQYFGYEDKKIESAAALIGAVGTGAIAGSLVGGSVGTAAGATVVALKVRQAIAVIGRIEEEPQDNWIFYETKDAPEEQEYSFQVTVWEDGIIRAQNQEVYYRDLIRASKINGRLVIILCRGGFSPLAGSTVIIYKS